MPGQRVYELRYQESALIDSCGKSEAKSDRCWRMRVKSAIAPSIRVLALVRLLIPSSPGPGHWFWSLICWANTSMSWLMQCLILRTEFERIPKHICQNVPEQICQNVYFQLKLGTADSSKRTWPLPPWQRQWSRPWLEWELQTRIISLDIDGGANGGSMLGLEIGTTALDRDEGIYDGDC